MQFKIDHVNITVNSLSDSIDWYQKMFGMKVVESGIRENGTQWAILNLNDSMVCMYEAKKQMKSHTWDTSPFHQIFHFGFRVPNLKEWLEIVNKYQPKLYYGGVNEYDHSKSWYIKDPTGHMIEVSYSDSPDLKFGN